MNVKARGGPASPIERVEKVDQGRGRERGEGRGGEKYALRDTLSPPTQLLFKRYGNARRRDQCYSHASAIKTHLDGILNLTEFS